MPFSFFKLIIAAKVDQCHHLFVAFHSHPRLCRWNVRSLCPAKKEVKWTEGTGEGNGQCRVDLGCVPSHRSVAHREETRDEGIVFQGDGALTPAVSVLSAVEGLALNAPHLTRWILPLTVLIIVVLFVGQQWGTAKIGELVVLLSTSFTLPFSYSQCLCSVDASLVHISLLHRSLENQLGENHSSSIESRRGHSISDQRETQWIHSDRSTERRAHRFFHMSLFRRSVSLCHWL